MQSKRLSLGLDFGTESVRAVLVEIDGGRVRGQAAARYEHGVIDRALPTGGGRLPPDYALQHPGDWLSAAGKAVRAARRLAGNATIAGIGVDFTSCTMLPARGDGTPLCLLPRWSRQPLAWPKLWKHHGAKVETDRINEVARERSEPWLARYGGVVGIEWFFPKMLETLRHAPAVYRAAEVWLEAGDWFVWQLVDGPFPACSPRNLTRSTCQAGYKAQWSRDAGYPSAPFLAAVHPGLADAVQRRMPGTLRAPGAPAGRLTSAAAQRLGLTAGIPVATAIIDAHAGVPGSGVAGADTLVMVLGTSSCHMLNSRVERLAPGLAGVVADGILPGFFGYETGQASVGDAFDWVVRTVGSTHEALTREAARLPPGGVLALDWLNGCRTPLMDGRLAGAFAGLTLGTTPAHLYRAMIEATGFGVRWIVDTLRDAGVPVRRLVASGGLPRKSPLLMQIYADILGQPIRAAASDQSVALGAAMLGAIACGAGAPTRVIRAMTPRREPAPVRPRPAMRRAYEPLYRLYRDLAAGDGATAAALRALRDAAS